MAWGWYWSEVQQEACSKFQPCPVPVAQDNLLPWSVLSHWIGSQQKPKPAGSFNAKEFPLHGEFTSL